MAKSNCPGAKFKILSFHGWRTSSSIGRFINVSNFWWIYRGCETSPVRFLNSHSRVDHNIGQKSSQRDSWWSWNISDFWNDPFRSTSGQFFLKVILAFDYQCDTWLLSIFQSSGKTWWNSWIRTQAWLSYWRTGLAKCPTKSRLIVGASSDIPSDILYEPCKKIRLETNVKSEWALYLYVDQI